MHHVTCMIAFVRSTELKIDDAVVRSTEFKIDDAVVRSTELKIDDCGCAKHRAQD